MARRVVKPRLFVVLAFVVLHALADRRRAHGAISLEGLVLWFPFLDLDVCRQRKRSCCLHGGGYAATHPLQVVKRGWLSSSDLAEASSWSQGSEGKYRQCPADYIAGQLVVALHAWRNRSGRAQGQYPQRAGRKCAEISFSLQERCTGCQRKPCSPTARYQPKLTSALLRAKGKQIFLRAVKGESVPRYAPPVRKRVRQSPQTVSFLELCWQMSPNWNVSNRCDFLQPRAPPRAADSESGKHKAIAFTSSPRKGRR